LFGKLLIKNNFLLASRPLVLYLLLRKMLFFDHGMDNSTLTNQEQFHIMEITEVKENNKLTLKLDGRFDALAALEMEKMLKKSLKGIEELVLDFADVKVIASAGLRVLVQTKKQMNTQGAMKIVNINDSVREILTITKLIKLLDVE